MKSYKQIIEAKTKSAVLAFGRFNPPTIGHEKLADVVKKEASKRGADAFIFASRSQDKKKNPLPFNIKQKYLAKVFKGIKVPDEKTASNPYTALKYLSDKGYNDVVLIAGSDRVKEYDKGIRPYIYHKDPDKSYEFDNFEVKSAGERDPDAEGAGGASGTKMREYAKNDDFESFKKYSPSKASEKDIQTVFNAVKQGLK